MSVYHMVNVLNPTSYPYTLFNMSRSVHECETWTDGTDSSDPVFNQGQE